MSTYRVILSRRSIRRFKQKPVSLKILKKLVNAARLAPSAGNLQPLKYVIVTEKEIRDRIFESLNWAGYLKPRWAPAENERPTAYIVILVDCGVSSYYQRDVGLASENIILTAEEEGLGGCIICNINKENIREVLGIPKNLEVDSVIALGYKSEKPVVEALTGSVEYWRDDDGVLHVPKRRLDDIMHINKYKPKN
ncbi:MAG: nitroreductase family protein [Candidatus Thermoplasmatota archaeon]